MLPKWSTPHRVVARDLNSYVLASLNGDQIPGSFSARRLRRFIPKEGTKLADAQKRLEEGSVDEGSGDAEADTQHRTEPNEEDQG